MKDHVLRTIAPSAKDFDYNAAVGRCTQWLIDKRIPRRCFRQKDQRESKCHCFLVLNNNADALRAVSRYMVLWAGFNQQTKKEVLNTWCQYGEFTPEKKLFLPCNYEDITKTYDNIMVCRNAVLNVLNVGRRMLVSARVNPSKPHGNVGKSGIANNRGKKNEEINASLKEYFTELQSEGLPFATRLIRERTTPKTLPSLPI